jgi:hypothetical protein
VLAGDPLPTMCKALVWNDGVVPVPSAVWQIRDNALSPNVHTDLTGTADFSKFVMPRLAVGPKGDHHPEAPDKTQFTSQAGFRDGSEPLAESAEGGPHAGDLLAFLTVAEDLRSAFARSAVIGANRSVEIEIPVGNASNFGVTFMAPPEISATLFNDKGAVAGKNSAGTPAAGAWFRSIFHDRPVNAGRWKLLLENTSDREMEAMVAAW